MIQPYREGLPVRCEGWTPECPKPVGPDPERFVAGAGQVFLGAMVALAVALVALVTLDVLAYHHPPVPAAVVASPSASVADDIVAPPGSGLCLLFQPDLGRWRAGPCAGDAGR